MFIGYIHSKWSFSIAMLIYQRVEWEHLIWWTFHRSRFRSDAPRHLDADVEGVSSADRFIVKWIFRSRKMILHDFHGLNWWYWCWCLMIFDDFCYPDWVQDMNIEKFKMLTWPSPFVIVLQVSTWRKRPKARWLQFRCSAATAGSGKRSNIC